MKKKTIITGNVDLYKKINMLNISPEIKFSSDFNKFGKINKMINAINKKENLIHMEKRDNEIVLKKINPVFFNVYLNGKNAKKNIYINKKNKSII